MVLRLPLSHFVFPPRPTLNQGVSSSNQWCIETPLSLIEEEEDPLSLQSADLLEHHTMLAWEGSAFSNGPLSSKVAPAPPASPSKRGRRQSLLSSSLPVNWEEDAGVDIDDDDGGDLDDLSKFARFVEAGVTRKAVGHRPETWPVHGGVRDLVAVGVRDRATVESRRRPCVVMPDSNFRMFWDLCLLVSLVRSSNSPDRCVIQGSNFCSVAGLGTRGN